MESFNQNPYQGEGIVNPFWPLKILQSRGETPWPPEAIGYSPSRFLPVFLPLVRLACLLAILTFPWLGFGAPEIPPLFKLEAKVETKAPVLAVAINADETLIAAASEDSGDKVSVLLLDRTSRGQLGSLVAEVGDHPRLLFSPQNDLLLIGGSESLQLWEVPLEPLKPDQILPEKYLRWSVPMDDETPLSGMAFENPPGSIIWSAGNALYRRKILAQGSESEQPVWRSGEEADITFVRQSGDKGLIVFDGKKKSLTILDPETLAPGASLAGHRFPVISAEYPLGGTLMSVDSGFNMIRWNSNNKPQSITFLKVTPSGAGNSSGQSLKPTGLLALNHPSYLVLAEGREGKSALLFNEELGKIMGRLTIQPPAALAASPTGRYVITGEGRSLKIYGFSGGMLPASYVRRLKALNAFKTARNYASLLDETGLSPLALEELQKELERAPTQLLLEDFLISLAAAERETNLDGMIYWAKKALEIDENNPEAVAALGRIRQIKEERILQQAGKALELGEYRQAISMLSSQFPSGSPRYSEALELIRLAEHARGLETVLEQAREKLNMGNLIAANALVNEALRKDGDNPAALALQDEISDRDGGIRSKTLGFFGALAAGIMVLLFGLIRFKSVWLPIMRKFSLAESEPLRTKGPRKAGNFQSAPKEKVRASFTPGKGTIPPRPERLEREMRKAVDELFEKTEELIRFSRQKDLNQQHTSFLLELEAELNVIHRRVVDRTTDLKTVMKRLGTMMTQLNTLKYGGPANIKALAANHSYYDVLKLSPQAKSAEIKTAYHRLLKEYHPDLHSQSTFGWVKEEAEKMSRKISEAYEVLSNTEKREQYDHELKTKGRT